jgi:hypothetical protein
MEKIMHERILLHDGRGVKRDGYFRSQPASGFEPLRFSSSGSDTFEGLKAI